MFHCCHALLGDAIINSVCVCVRVCVLVHVRVCVRESTDGSPSAGLLQVSGVTLIGRVRGTETVEDTPGSRRSILLFQRQAQPQSQPPAQS